MKKLLLLVFCLYSAYAQAATPTVPDRLYFGDLRLKLTEAARREIQKDVDRLTKYESYFNKKVERAKTYFPIIEEIFRKEGVPDEFKYLVLQESELVADAVSSSNAVGYWQMKDFTAMELGLRVDRNIDERMNIVASSIGAARYFKKGYSTFENWLNALQSYQMGIGGAKRALGDSDRGVKTMTINTRTYWYVRKFLAHLVAFQNEIEGPASYSVTKYLYGANKSLQDIARETGKDYEELKELNKWLLRGKIPSDRPYVVIIPGSFKALQDVVAEKNVPIKKIDKPIYQNNENNFPKILNKRYKDHKYIIGVNGLPGIIASSTDNIQTLAKKGRVSSSQFMRYNDLSSNSAIVAGQVYYLKRKKRKAATHYHTMEPDETLWQVSQKYGIRIDKLLQKNRMVSNTKTKPGRVLWLRFIRPKDIPVEYSHIEEKAPGNDEYAAEIMAEKEQEQQAKEQDEQVAAVETEQASSNIEEKEEIVEEEEEEEPVAEVVYSTTGKNRKIHRVSKGETFYSISKKYDVPVGALLQWNDLAITDTIFIGNELVIYTESNSSNVNLHTVQAGETLYKIARQYDVSVDEILEWNNKIDYHLKVGEKLKILKSK